jgi:hypothetical protein
MNKNGKLHINYRESSLSVGSSKVCKLRASNAAIYEITVTDGLRNSLILEEKYALTKLCTNFGTKRYIQLIEVVYQEMLVNRPVVAWEL